MYIAPLRHAVLHLGSERAPFSLDDVADLGKAAVSQARGYLSRLVADGIVLETGHERYVANGVIFDAWTRRPTKTKPGGHRIITYRAVSKV